MYLAALAFVTVFPITAAPTELKPESAQAFDRYVARTELRLQGELSPGNAFLYVNGVPESRRIDLLAQLKAGEVVMTRVQNQEVAGGIQTPGALIHHWIGTVFIPGASLADVLAVVQDYDHHQDYFRPEVARSKTLARSGNDFKVYLRLTRKKIITVVLDTEYDVHYEQLDATRAQSRSYSTRITEIRNPGESNESRVPPGNDNGFLWPLDSYWRFVEAGQGVYIQCEAISLTRDLPAGLHWLLQPFIESIPKESLDFTLRSTRTAVLHEISQHRK